VEETKDKSELYSRIQRGFEKKKVKEEKIRKEESK
jgi:hypothetical protein